VLIGVARELSLVVYFIVVISSVALLYSNLRLFTSIAFGALNKNLISNATNDFSHLELFCALFLAAHAFLLMWDNAIFFEPICNDLLIRYFINK